MLPQTLLLTLLPLTLALPTSQEARACTGPTVNAATVSLIKEFEGFVASPASDPIGLPTVGYGHQCTTSDCSEVPYSFPLSESTATSLLMSDLVSPQQAITLDTAAAVTLNANEYGALVSWAYNVGNGNVASSTLLSRLNAGEDALTVIEQELPKWDQAGGETLPGLTRRRAAEVALAQTATGVGAIPAC
ncbi:lysozyme [Mytilinidion resinicola]|uniref:Lysozyme n=1 Tax=Mytilinidion resinicola TaxID=574789 RepID=A0A6A6Y6C2_9PEZI|nr:lysozyme [Mytilinidion resinicola]KAF2804159.1 lysozyme [Mytilinidion resinicola]